MVLLEQDFACFCFVGSRATSVDWCGVELSNMCLFLLCLCASFCAEIQHTVQKTDLEGEMLKS